MFGGPDAQLRSATSAAGPAAFLEIVQPGLGHVRGFHVTARASAAPPVARARPQRVLRPGGAFGRAFGNGRRSLRAGAPCTRRADASGQRAVDEEAPALGGGTSRIALRRRVRAPCGFAADVVDQPQRRAIPHERARRTRRPRPPPGAGRPRGPGTRQPPAALTDERRRPPITRRPPVPDSRAEATPPCRWTVLLPAWCRLTADARASRVPPQLREQRGGAPDPSPDRGGAPRRRISGGLGPPTAGGEDESGSMAAVIPAASCGTSSTPAARQRGPARFAVYGPVFERAIRALHGRGPRARIEARQAAHARAADARESGSAPRLIVTTGATLGSKRRWPASRRAWLHSVMVTRGGRRYNPGLTLRPPRGGGGLREAGSAFMLAPHHPGGGEFLLLFSGRAHRHPAPMASFRELDASTDPKKTLGWGSRHYGPPC